VSEANPFDRMVINRCWAMSNKLTFTIKPIRHLLDKYVTGIVIDPFANASKYGTITNDLNPGYGTDYNMDAVEFLEMLDSNSADVALYDPPFSMRQASECYKNYGESRLTGSVTNMQYWANVKNEIARVVKPGGLAICCGWRSGGIGKNRGFEIIEILLVPHGGNKNDTIVTVERKGL